MAYYTGSVNSYSDLILVVSTVCANHGWAYSNGILSKGTAFVALELGGSGSNGEGVLAQGGSGQNAGTLVDPSPIKARLGRPTSSGNYWEPVSWPVSYHIHISENPDEVYILLNVGITGYYWLAFGRSAIASLPGSGLWLSGTIGAYDSGSRGISITNTGGNRSSSDSCPAPFWGTPSSSSSASYFGETVHTGPEAWSGFSGEALLGVSALSPLIERSPSNWNGESVLLPIRVYQTRPESKMRLVAELAHTRYVRLKNLEPGQIITLGTEQWKVYPFYKKNASSPNGGSSLSHTGTFGWALRHEEAA
ncbi:hypothetical protein [Comamonas sp.]|uniref:hypothetical protein n=1 Tax=Comamonas sp. TaxID=34028 RepID=UPI00258B2E97|nr:hypothetical protein [Comamonas sp.]